MQHQLGCSLRDCLQHQCWWKQLQAGSHCWGSAFHGEMVAIAHVTFIRSSTFCFLQLRLSAAYKALGGVLVLRQ